MESEGGFWVVGHWTMKMISYTEEGWREEQMRWPSRTAENKFYRSLIEAHLVRRRGRERRIHIPWQESSAKKPKLPYVKEVPALWQRIPGWHGFKILFI